MALASRIADSLLHRLRHRRCPLRADDAAPQRDLRCDAGAIARTRIGESQVRIVNQADSKFFGFEPVDVLGYKVMISDREKTAIDCIDLPALAGGVGEAATILANASRRFDWTKVADYLERIGSGALARRFGWLVDHVKADVPAEIRDRLLRLAARSRKTWLGPDPARASAVHGAIGYDETWRLFVNVTREELHGSAGLGRRKTVRKDS